MEIKCRAEVIGSMLRPDYLKKARKQWTAGEISTWEFKKIEDRAVDESIILQERCGVDVITDGEMRRTHFIAPLTDVITGVREIPAFKRVWKLPHEKSQRAEQTEITVQFAVVDKIRRTRSLTNEEFSYARARANKPLKVTLPSPLMMTLRWSREHSRDAYPDPFEMLADAAAIVRDEARELAALGCEYIQIDAPELGMLCDPERARTDFADIGVDPERFLSEYDDWRSGSFEPLRAIPTDKTVVLGLISTKRVELEPAETVEKRVDEAIRFFPREQLALSTQCGFGTVWEGNPISEAAEAAKLKLVANIAHDVWPRGAASL